MKEPKLKRAMYLHGRIHTVKMYISEIEKMEKAFIPNIACTSLLRCIIKRRTSEVSIGNIPIPLDDTLLILETIRESYELELSIAQKELEEL